jgi:hypothetical protein
VVLDLISSPEDGGWEVEDDDWPDCLITLRANLAEGDLRDLYLGWLFGLQEDFGFVGEDETDGDEYAGEDESGGEAGEDGIAGSIALDGSAVEPPVPPGLRQLTEPLKALVEFLRIDQDLLAIAAERSPDLTATRPSAADINRWLETLPVAAKDAVILRLLAGEGTDLRLELLRRYQEATAPSTIAVPPGRKVGELLNAAQAHAVQRRRKEAERAVRAKARREREAAAARAAYLDGLAGREESVWRQVESLIESKSPKAYDEAARLLVDLRDLAARSPSPAFATRLSDLRVRHARKLSFVERLTEARL